VSPARLWFVLALALTASACTRRKAVSLRDTENRTFSAKCDAKDDCKLTLASGEHEPDKTALALYNPGNLVGVCDVVEGKPPESPSDCRPLVCTVDTDCPPKHGLDHGTCINGLCREPEFGQIAVEDAVMLCLDGTGLGTTHPDRLAMALNCGTPCRVPTVCRQP
jgi:hypothetical protein